MFSKKKKKFGRHMSRVPHMGDNSTYSMACHYITCDTCGIYATSDAENNKKLRKLNFYFYFKKRKFKKLDAKIGGDRSSLCDN